MQDNRLIIILGLTGAAIGMWLLLRPKEAVAVEVKVMPIEKPFPIQTITLSGFVWPVDTLIKDLRSKGYITSVSCVSKTTLIKECRVTIYSSVLTIVKQLATIYGVSVYG